MKNNEISYPEEIYIKYLAVINCIKFTPREMEVIACILDRKSIKWIANFLSDEDKSIGKAAIESHIMNIRRKIRGSSRESIIDFIEQSDKYQIVHDYYVSLLVQKEFKKNLQQISILIKPYIKSFLIVYYQEQGTKSFAISQLQSHLKLLLKNIQLEDIKPDLIPIPSNIERQHTIFIAPKNEEMLSEKVVANTIKKTTTIGKNQLLITTLFLLHGENHIKSISTKLPTFEYINLVMHSNYYYLFFEILRKLFPNLNLDEIITRFSAQYEGVLGLYMPTRSFLDNEERWKEKENNTLKPIFYFSKQLSYLYIFLIVFVAVSGYLVLYYNKGPREKEEFQKSTGLAIQENVSKILTQSYEGLSPNNLTRDRDNSNYNIVKRFDKVIELINSGKMQLYFNGNALQTNELINCIYNLNAIASYYLFREDGGTKKSEKILEYAKNLAENYLINIGKVQISFDKLTEVEIYTELSTIKDLPEMYTSLSYFLGRSLLFQRNIELAEKYFRLSKYLGNKTGLFKEILSTRGGLAIIQEEQADINIKNGEYEKAQKNLKDCINTYEKIMTDTKRYKSDYKPNDQNPIIIVPAKDSYNIVECGRRIVKLYTKLIVISDNRSEKISYLQAVSSQIIGNSTKPGILEILVNSNVILARTAAGLYNNLGNFLLKLYDENIDFQQFKDGIVKKLNLTKGDSLEIIYRLFNLARSSSKNSELAKVEAYDGLIKVCERLISHTNITEGEKKKLLTEMQNFRDARDVINKELRRSATN